MPGVSTTGVYQQVRRMTIPVANWTGAAVSGNTLPYGPLALNTTHGLTDGRLAPTAPNTYPSWVAEQMDSFRAFVVFSKGQTYGGVEPYVSFPSYSAAGTDRVQVIVATELLDECYARVQNDDPVYLELRVLFKSPHSIEGMAADQGEGFPTSPIGSLLALPRGSGTSNVLENIYVDPVNGADTNSGHSLAAAWETMGRVQEYLEEIGTFNRCVHVHCSAGPVTDWDAAHSNFTLEGVRFIGGARLFITGSAPDVDAVVPVMNQDKLVTLTGIGFAAAVRDGEHLRLAPQNGETWTDNSTGFDIAFDAADIGKTIRIAGAGNVAYATVSGVNGEAGATGERWVECNMNHPLFLGGVPAWVTAVGTQWAVLDHTDPQGAAASANAQVTAMAGTWYIGNIQSAVGSQLQDSIVVNKQHCIGHIRFVSEQVRISNCDNFAFPGCRFEAGLSLSNCHDLTSIANAVSDNTSDRYLPRTVWTKLGFDPVHSVDSYGGLGFFVVATATGADPYEATFEILGSHGALYGCVVTGAVAPDNGYVFVEDSTVRFAWGSFGPDGANLLRLYCINKGAASMEDCHMSWQCVATRGGEVYVDPHNSWVARAINLADDAPDATNALTHIDVNTALANGVLHAEHNGLVVMSNTGGNSIEGIVAEGDYGQLVFIDRGSRFIAYGGHDATLFGNRGWLFLTGASTAYMGGNRTFAEKANVGGLAADVYVYNSVLNTGATDVWTKAGDTTGDSTPSPVVYVEHHGNFKLGTTVSGAPAGRLVVGATGAGNGIHCGASGCVLVQHGSHCTIADLRVNNDDGAAGNPAIVIHHGAFFHHTGDNIDSFVERVGANVNAITNGSITFNGFVPTGEAAHHQIHSDYLAALGTAQGTYYRHE